MLIYFEIFNIGSFKKNSRSVRNVPIFPPKLWNVNDRIDSDLPRTKNALESWHKNLENSWKKHPTINKLVQQFYKIEQNFTDIIKDQGQQLLAKLIDIRSDHGQWFCSNNRLKLFDNQRLYYNEEKTKYIKKQNDIMEGRESEKIKE
ncbi:unnamed protein product [Brachionus calyciflorus]|uniref:Uncharacterized protein n=1 Tax=Brachionus calyciflorus TaxID=104777 RepID=A0A814GD33_9BILA|nr:unnamed protein product [Brachionus calyciflorus]